MPAKSDKPAPINKNYDDWLDEHAQEPFTFVWRKKRYVLAPPNEQDAFLLGEAAATGDGNDPASLLSYFRVLAGDDNYDRLRAAKLPMSVMQQIFEDFTAAYDLGPTPESDD